MHDSSVSVNEKGERVRWMILVQAGLVALIGGMSFLVSVLSVDLEYFRLPAAAMVSFVVCWNFFSWRLLGLRWFGPYGLFLVSASLFHGGQALLELFGLNSNGIMGDHFSPEVTVKALYLASLGLSALHLGAIYAIGRVPCRERRPTPFSDESRLRASRRVGWICISLAALPAMIVLKDVVSIVASRGYQGLYGRPDEEILPSTIQTLAAGIIPGLMFLAIGSQRHRHLLKILWGVVIAYSGILMLAGIRSGGALLLISFTWLYHARICPLARTTRVSASLALLALFSIVAVQRQGRTSWFDFIGETHAPNDSLRNPLVSAVAEMGGTLGTVAETISLIPSSRPLDHGIGYAYALLTLIPNVAWDVHPAVAHGYAIWLVNTVDPSVAKHGGGLGYSFLAEAYANFGWYGVVPVLALIGYLLVRASDWAAQSQDAVRSAALATAMAFLLFLPRSESATQVRPVVVYSILPYIAVGVLSSKRAASQRLMVELDARLAPIAIRTQKSAGNP